MLSQGVRQSFPYMYRGACHCGSIRLSFGSESDPAALSSRCCTCTFCTRHGAIWTSDADGFLEITVSDEAALSRYRFGTGTADFLICKTCGSVAVAVMEEEEKGIVAVLNTNLLEDRDAFQEGYGDISYDGEEVEDRLTRRSQRWTPAKIRFG